MRKLEREIRLVFPQERMVQAQRGPAFALSQRPTETAGRRNSSVTMVRALASISKPMSSTQAASVFAAADRKQTIRNPERDEHEGETVKTIQCYRSTFEQHVQLRHQVARGKNDTRTEIIRSSR